MDGLTERLKLVIPMPTYKKTVNGTKRDRLDLSAMQDVIDMLLGFEVEVLVVENVGAGFGAGGRELGEQVGVIKALAWKANLPVEWVPVTKWKKAMTCPADKKEACFRAEALFLHDREMVRGTKGGRADGKAEAAMIALYGARHILTRAL